MKSNEIHFEDLGLIDYKKAWDYQEKLFNEILQAKSSRSPQNKETKNHLLFCEHPHVYTLGKSGDQSNLLINKNLLKQKGASFYRINRGGDITYHGPGQIVGYPILNLEKFGLGVKDYIFKLEESIIQTLKEYGIESSRLEGATGVWLDVKNPVEARKICAIGVRASRYVSMHGFAFNVNTDLSFYNLINPCGFTDKGVTSMEKELGKKSDFKKVQNILLRKFVEIFNAKVNSG